MTDAGPSSMPLVEHVSTAFLGSRQVPLAYDATLPPMFRDRQVLFPAGLRISQIASQISLAAGMPVDLSPDVYIARRALVPGASGAAGKTGDTAQAVPQEDPVYPLAYMGSLGGYLRTVTDGLGLDWKTDGTRISISRFVTRTFTLAATPGKRYFKSDLSKGTSASTGAQGGSDSAGPSNTGSFSTASSMGQAGETDFMKSIEKTLDALKSPMGSVTLNEQTRLVMVHDTRENVDRMAELLKRENAILTRQVAIRVRRLEIAIDDNSQAGADLNVVYNRIQAGLTRYAIGVSSVPSLAATAGSAIGVSILRPGAPLSGTNAVLSGLNQFGKTVDDNTQTRVTPNGVPVAVGDFHTQGYLAQTTPASGGLLSGGTGGIPGLTPGSVTTGSFLNLMPWVNDNNQIMLTIWTDDSHLQAMQKESSGKGDYEQSIQLPEVAGSKTDQTVALADGQTLVMYGGMKDRYNAASNNGIGGASGLWGHTHLFQVMVVSAYVVPSM
ncbi:type II secretory pathway protein [Burkholderia cepacia]|uniref:type II secretory pathway protein n=1 Tax=Burkholderia cepacia TaxID=292 RepID=UPI002ABD8DD5|nr:type II secretory pathway protein [Burkholderia cepacia]